MIRHPTGRVAPRRAIVVFVVATLATIGIAGGLAARSVTSDADEGIAAFATADFSGVAEQVGHVSKRGQGVRYG